MGEETQQVALTREQILGAKDMLVEPVEIPAWGGTVYVRTMSARARDLFEGSRVRVTEDRKTEIISDNTRARLLSMCVCDEHGVLLFTEQDIAALGEKNALAADTLYDVALRLNAMRLMDLEKKLKN